jgi:hypothetical protein
MGTSMTVNPIDNFVCRLSGGVAMLASTKATLADPAHE